MAIKVLVVDDSSFFRKRLREIIDADPALEVVGEAKDGKEGVAMAAQLRPNVITMDVEMPVMDGITAVKEIMAKSPTPILMFSSLTHEGAQATFKALEAGAIDFMPKNFDDIAHRREDGLNALRSSIKAVARSRVGLIRSTPRPATTVAARPAAPAVTTPRITPAASAAAASSAASQSSAMGQYRKINEMLGHEQGVPAAAKKFTFGDHKSETTQYKKSGKQHSIVAIGSSTGGPIALQNLIPKLPKLSVPVVIVQHMPASFTETFAQRLDAISQLHVVEAKEGDILEPGTCYIAPGGKQMIFERVGVKTKVRILKDEGRVAYNPCVDVSFASLNQIYGGKTLAMILTGMGSDGCEGCKLMKQRGAVVWAQNEETCVVYGMPQAIVNAGIADLVLPLEEIAPSIVKEFQ
ncbi:MAG: chemotaxis response regulator protein-glutamate methylesterase [Succinivibrio sp.]|nr:chemotaxis response regulator protein-glutamate methylesterase [Succinivibrio sp.]